MPASAFKTSQAGYFAPAPRRVQLLPQLVSGIVEPIGAVIGAAAVTMRQITVRACCSRAMIGVVIEN